MRENKALELATLLASFGISLLYGCGNTDNTVAEVPRDYGQSVADMEQMTWEYYTGRASETDPKPFWDFLDKGTWDDRKKQVGYKGFKMPIGGMSQTVVVGGSSLRIIAVCPFSGRAEYILILYVTGEYGTHPVALSNPIPPPPLGSDGSQTRAEELEHLIKLDVRPGLDGIEVVAWKNRGTLVFSEVMAAYESVWK